MVVGRRVHRLGQVDDHRAVGAEQHVELREVAVHQPGAEHHDDLADEEVVVFARLLRLQHHVVEARRGVTVFVGDHFHQQHAVEEVVGLGYPHPGIGQAEQRRHLGVLPGLLLLAPAIARALGHGPGLAAVAHLAALLVFRGLAETAFVGLLVDLGAAQLLATAHHVDRRFLAAHQRAQHFVDQAVLDQRLYAFGCLHQAPSSFLSGPCGRSRSLYDMRRVTPSTDRRNHGGVVVISMLSPRASAMRSISLPRAWASSA